MSKELMIFQNGQPQVSNISPLVAMANDYNKINMVFDSFSAITTGYYGKRTSRHSLISGKNAKDRSKAVNLLIKDALKNRFPVFFIHRGSAAKANKGKPARVFFPNGSSSGYWPLKWLDKDNAVETLTALGVRILEHDQANSDFWDIAVFLIERNNGELKVKLDDISNFPCHNIDSMLKILPSDEQKKYRKRYEQFADKHDIAQVAQLCRCLRVLGRAFRWGNCTVGGVIDNNATMNIDLSRFQQPQADLLQELLCIEIETAVKAKNRNVLIIFDDLRMLKSTDSSFNRLVTQMDRHVSVIFSCGDLFTACNGDDVIFNQIVSKADTDVFLFAQPSENLEYWSSYFGKQLFMSVNISRSTNEALDSIADHLPNFFGEKVRSVATNETQSTSTEMRYKFTPEMLASIVNGCALGRISSENQLYGLNL